MARRKKIFKKVFKNKKFSQYLGILIIIILVLYIIGCLFFPKQMEYVYDYLGIDKEEVLYSSDISSIPEYSGTDYVIINNNIPFTDIDKLTTEEFETYSDLDSLGRCGVAYANISVNTMPTDERGSIGTVKPSGWHTIKYEGIDGNYLYNRCHLIGYQLSGENANQKNLITCTRQMNTGKMLELENMVAEYVRNTGNHVMYRVTPIFKDRDLVAYGVQMEAISVEDNGEGIKFNIFVYNVQDGITIDYSDGTSKLSQ